MGILLDPKKQYIQIDLYYIEDVRKHGNSVFQFINSQNELEDMQRKGYRLEDKEPAIQGQGQPTQPAQPGMPVISSSSDKVIHQIKTRWRRLRWKDQNTIFSACMKNIPVGEGRVSTEMDVIQFRDMKLKTCLKWWSLKGDDGEEVPVTHDAIDNLVPEVAQQLLEDFEKVTELSEEDVKK